MAKQVLAYQYVIYAKTGSKRDPLVFHDRKKTKARKAAQDYARYLQTTEDWKFYYKRPCYNGQIDIT